MAQQHRAGRLAWPDDAHASAVAGVCRPLGIVSGDAATVIVGHVDGLGTCGQRRDA